MSNSVYTNNLVIGGNNKINHNNSIVSGHNNLTQNNGQLVLGQYCSNSSDYSICLGGGTNDNTRKDVFYVKNDGSVYSDNDLNVKNNILINNTNIFNLIYPVGSIYISKNSTNPAILFGVGTWSLIKGKFIYGADPDDLSNFPVDDTGGGSKRLVASNIPELTTTYDGGGTATWSSRSTRGDWDVEYSSTDNFNLSMTKGQAYNSGSGGVGGGAQKFSLTLYDHQHKIGTITQTDYMQPYIVRYIWERTA